ncbi:putative bifunctional diguanylate cyclase/phosphodiesterase [Erythrobacter ani]|uniref:putative bifunctional diguanylate cyclase/phosphodiesterase n=1 Tax=Erythrobacter ani TaxID=2827235 RepID=UPI0021074A22|nr:GGDEF and EAL domain-containing protein [Erythrobacter ani]
MSVSAVLGFKNRGDADWVRLRGLQYASLAKLTVSRGCGQAVLALFVAQIYIGTVPLHWLAAWLLGLCLVHARGILIDNKLADSESRTVTSQDFRRNLSSAILSGLMWSVPVLVFAPFGTATDLASLLLVLVLIVAGSIYFATNAPISIVGATILISLATMTHAALSDMWILVGMTFVFMVASVLGAIEVGRVHLAARIAETSLVEKEEVVSLLLREFEENEADWLWEIDTTRRLRSVSPRFAFALGHRQSEVEGKPLLELIATRDCDPRDYAPSLRELAERLKAHENFSNLIVHVSIRGEERWWELSGTPMRDDRGKFIGFRGVGSDVTEQRASSEKIAYLARFDTLTALPNRLQINEGLGEALRYAAQWRTRCALLMVDLDRFKAVNDSLGHMIGDKLLAQVSSRLQTIIGGDLLCGRLGGDEFAIVIRDASDSDLISSTALKVIEVLSEPYQVDQHTLYVGASVGSAVGPRDGNSVEELMRNADLALYRAKDVGGGEHCRFEPELHATAEERRRLEVSLRKAVLEDEFVLHYQPVVDARNEQIVSFEALVRWNSPEHGFVSPGKFIPLAEDTRLIVPLGRWILRESCMEARAWPDDIKVNVNVSPEQLLEPEFHQDVIDALAASGLRPERLEVEVTESIFVRDATTARNSLEQIMALGCSVALDDFGTGYSSLGYLRKLRFSTIKVDRTFVQGAAQGSNESLAIINAVVAMAQSLDMTTTAEGVETAEEAELIRNLGCDKIQGFYFGRPMSKEEAIRLFRTMNDQREAS